jgi:hypothetical protein
MRTITLRRVRASLARGRRVLFVAALLSLAAAFNTTPITLGPTLASAAVVSGADQAAPAAKGGGGGAGGASDITTVADNTKTMVRTLAMVAVAIAIAIRSAIAAFDKKYGSAIIGLGFCVLAAVMATDAGFDLIVNTGSNLAKFGG